MMKIEIVGYMTSIQYDQTREIDLVGDEKYEDYSNEGQNVADLITQALVGDYQSTDWLRLGRLRITVETLGDDREVMSEVS